MRKRFIIFLLGGCSLSIACSTALKEEVRIPEFPYQSCLEMPTDSLGWLILGDDHNGFIPISDKISYLRISDSLNNCENLDTLIQIYNIAMIINAQAYDCGTINRLGEDLDFKDFAESLQKVDWDVISNEQLRKTLKLITHEIAEDILNEENTDEKNYPLIHDFYILKNNLFGHFIDVRTDYSEYDCSAIIDDYEAIHKKAITDTLNYRNQLLTLTLNETDFEKKCIYAREFAYANYRSYLGNDKDLVTIIDPLLKKGEYSPLLYELWLMWRSTLQMIVFSSASNDAPMYNLFYNNMRNNVAKSILTHLKSYPDDKLAFKVFMKLAHTHNIVRNSSCPIGNNALLDEMNLYRECQ